MAARYRDVAGIYFAFANANVDVTGLVTNEVATNMPHARPGSVNPMVGRAAPIGHTTARPAGISMQCCRQQPTKGSASTNFADSHPPMVPASLSRAGTRLSHSLRDSGPGFVLEPQAQIVREHVSFDDDNDGLGDVALGSTSGASGRLGLRGRWTIVSDGSRVW